jgi:hypothetical protein
MKLTIKWNSMILDELAGHGINAKIVTTGILAIDRTSAHNARICSRLDESQIINKIKEIVESAIYKLTAKKGPEFLITWGEKTDDFWFLEVYDKTAKSYNFWPKVSGY